MDRHRELRFHGKGRSSFYCFEFNIQLGDHLHDHFR